MVEALEEDRGVIGLRHPLGPEEVGLHDLDPDLVLRGPLADDAAEVRLDIDGRHLHPEQRERKRAVAPARPELDHAGADRQIKRPQQEADGLHMVTGRLAALGVVGERPADVVGGDILRPLVLQRVRVAGEPPVQVQLELAVGRAERVCGPFLREVHAEFVEQAAHGVVGLMGERVVALGDLGLQLGRLLMICNVGPVLCRPRAEGRCAGP